MRRAGLRAGLYVVGTPIGNLADVTLRALETLGGVDCIFAEDTRHTARLLARHGITTPLLSCHRYNERAREGEIFSRIRGGEAVALVSDAGMPGISDPGARTVAAARRMGIEVRVVPGPCALTAALALCGWHRGSGHRFEGFLDKGDGRRRRRLGELGRERVPVVFYESPYRVEKFLQEVKEELGGGRRIFVARELTKAHEEGVEGTAEELLAYYAEHSKKGEFVLVLLPEEGGGG